MKKLMKEFTDFVEKAEHDEFKTIGISDEYGKLGGKGEEYVIKNGIVCAKLFNGNLTCVIPQGNDEITKVN